MSDALEAARLMIEKARRMVEINDKIKARGEVSPIWEIAEMSALLSVAAERDAAVAEVEALRGIIKRTARETLADSRSFRAATIEECAKVADAYAIAPTGEDCCAVAYGIADRLRSLTKGGLK